MKKILFPILALTLALFLFSCEDEPVEEEVKAVNPFIGTWERPDIDDTRLIFTEKVGTLYKPLDTLIWTGTYTYDDNKITVTIDKENSMPDVAETYGDSFTLTYKFENNLLTFGSTLYRKITGN